MTTPTPAPDTAPVDRRRSRFIALYNLMLRTQVTRARLLSLGALAAVGILSGLAIGLSEGVTQSQDSAELINTFGLSLLVPVTALVFASAALGDPREDGSMVYLWFRPVPRSIVTLAAWTASLTAVLPLVTITLAISAALASDGNSSVIAATVLSATVATVMYSAVFLALGLRVQRALVWGLAYILIWEGFVARAGQIASRVALVSYTRSILTNTSDATLDLATVSPVMAYAVPIVVTALALLYVAARFQRQEVA
jgi:ABC-2 type transport system permease protein